MLNKRAAAEQLRKYATVARLIREQREMQKRAAAPKKEPLGGVPPAYYDPEEASDWLDYHRKRLLRGNGAYTNLTKDQWDFVMKQPGTTGKAYPANNRTYLQENAPDYRNNLEAIKERWNNAWKWPWSK